jgi:2-dehydro-3-deoxyphosphogluconate aldolase/(4S)-4-hydroxy-2-oxoglutarate aldolase
MRGVSNQQAEGRGFDLPMDRTRLISELHASRLVAVVRSKSAEEALELAQAAVQGGIKFVEITFSVPGAVDVIGTLVKRAEIHVGAGTVLASAQAEAGIMAGAQFIVSPTVEQNLAPVCREANVAWFPGAATPTEIITAVRAGADLVKIFPADLVGGVDFIRQMRGPFPDVRFMVSGGVSLDNIQAYVRAGVIGICLGSAYLGGLLEQKGRDAFASEVRRFVKLVAEAQG